MSSKVQSAEQFLEILGRCPKSVQCLNELGKKWELGAKQAYLVHHYGSDCIE